MFKLKLPIVKAEAMMFPLWQCFQIQFNRGFFVKLDGCRLQLCSFYVVPRWQIKEAPLAALLSLAAASISLVARVTHSCIAHKRLWPLRHLINDNGTDNNGKNYDNDHTMKITMLIMRMERQCWQLYTFDCECRVHMWLKNTCNFAYYLHIILFFFYI